MISQILSVVVDWVWGLPLVLLLLGGGLYLIVFSRGKPFFYFFHALKLTFGQLSTTNKSLAKGQLSHFQALCNALSATIGVGNIAGVAVAIYQGGPGALFWMWVAALIGMNTKFFECTLAVMKRGKDYKGEIQGGPMYYMMLEAQEKKKRFWKGAAYFFGVFSLLGTLTLFQINQLSGLTKEYFHIPKLGVGISVAVLVGYLYKGGVVRIARLTSILTPLMCVLYVLACGVILSLNMERIPFLFMLIFKSAFSMESVYGGFIGVMLIGVKRAAFSNEAGVGTAPMAHSNAKTNEPIAEGLVSMTGPFLDTILVCTMTALTILCYMTDGLQGDQLKTIGPEGVLLTMKTFEHFLDRPGGLLLTVSVVLFSITTIVGYSNYCGKSWNFLFKGKFGLNETTFFVFYCLAIVAGSVLRMDDVINLLDIAFGLMAFPNMLFLIWSAPKVMKAFNAYQIKHL